MNRESEKRTWLSIISEDAATGRGRCFNAAAVAHQPSRPPCRLGPPPRGEGYGDREYDDRRRTGRRECCRSRAATRWSRGARRTYRATAAVERAGSDRRSSQRAAGDLHSARSGGRRVNGGGGGHQPHGRDRDRSTSPPRVSCDIQRPPVPRSSERSAFRRGHWAVGRPSVRVTCLPLSCCGQPVGESSQVSCRP
jgi:hypothetical protein